MENEELDWDETDESEDAEEPIGCCDECECDIYEEDSFDGLCSYCAWVAAGCPEPADTDGDQ